MVLQTRITNKRDTKENWDNVGASFIPLNGEIIIYTDISRLKIGDGDTVLNELPFITLGMPSAQDDPDKTQFDITNDEITKNGQASLANLTYEVIE